MHIRHAAATKPLRVREQPANVVGRFDEMCHGDVRPSGTLSGDLNALLYHEGAIEEELERPCGEEAEAVSGGLEQDLLLCDFRQSALQFFDTFLQALIIEAEKIEAVQQLFALNVRPFQRALQTG